MKLKRKLPSIASCRELSVLNKTMIIEVPTEFRKPGQPFFQIVSTPDDLEEPKVKFNANNILKIILEKGTEGRKLISVCANESSLQSTQISHTTSTIQGIPPVADSDPNLNSNRFDFPGKSSLMTSDYSSQGLEVHNQKPLPLTGITEKNSAMKNLQRAGDNSTIIQLTEYNHGLSQGPKNNSRPFQVSKDELRTIQEFHDRDWEPANKDINFLRGHNCYDSGSFTAVDRQEDFRMNSNTRFPQGASNRIPPQEMHFQDPKFNPVEKHKPLSPQQKNYNSSQQTHHDSRMFVATDGNSDLFQQFTSHSSELSPQHSEHKNRTLESEEKNLKLSCNYDYGPLEQRPYHSHSDTSPNDVAFNQHSSQSAWERPYQKMNEKFLSSPRQIGQIADYVSKQNDTFRHESQLRQRTLLEVPSAAHGRNLPRGFTGDAFKQPHKFLPQHVFQSDPDLSGATHMLIVNIISYPNFFLHFPWTPPAGMHIWAIMRKGYKLKFPETPVNDTLLSMKLLHIVVGDIKYNLPNLLQKLHEGLPITVPFTIVSHQKFPIVKSIAAGNRTVNVVSSGHKEIMSHICHVVHS